MLESKSNVRILVSLFLFFIFFVYYILRLKTVPITYYDENWYVGRSFFFELFIKGDFKNPLWQTYLGYDQPKLIEYIFGASFYPAFIQEKTHKTTHNLNTYLIDNNFYEQGNLQYRDYKSNNASFINWQPGDSGTQKELIQKYGKNISKTIELIYKARAVNAFLLALSIVVIFFITKQLMSTFVSFILSVLFGSNTLLISTSLVAHADALFLLLFNAGVLLLLLLLKKKTFKLLISFIAISGLCMSTKLNGSILLIIFNLIVLVKLLLSYFHSKTRDVKNLFIISSSVTFFSLFLVVLLDPYLYSNPIKNWVYMYSFRDATSSWQMTAFGPTLYSYSDRLIRILENFFLVKSSTYNLLSFFNVNNAVINIFYMFTFIFGLIVSIKKSGVSRIFLFIFLIVLITLISYLKLDWDRYYLPLLYFVLYFEICGMTILVRKILLLLVHSPLRDGLRIHPRFNRKI